MADLVCAGDVDVRVGTSLESDEQVAEVKPIKPEQIDALIPFLDKCEEAGFLLVIGKLKKAICRGSTLTKS